MATTRSRMPVTHDESHGSSMNVIPFYWEEHVLKPVKESSDEDWPSFVLKDAIIYDADGITHANLLHAGQTNPLIIRGMLEVPAKERKLQLVESINGQYIEIPRCRTFAFGEPSKLWASGLSGWFEIHPHESYAVMYDLMVEAVDLYYRLLDAHEAKEWKARDLGIEYIYLEYLSIEETDEVVFSREAFSERCRKHSQFLRLQMKKPDEQSNWNKSLLLQWLAFGCPIEESSHSWRFPEIGSQQLAQQVKSKARSQRGQRDQVERSSGSEIPAASVVEPQEPVNDRQHIVIEAAHSSSTIPETIVQRIRLLETSGESTRETITLGKVCNLVYQKFKIKQPQLAAELVKLHSSAILELLGDDWAVSKLSDQLQDLPTPIGEQKAFRSLASTVVLVPRDPKYKRKPHEDAATAAVSSPVAKVPQFARLPPGRTHATRAILRPGLSSAEMDASRRSGVSGKRPRDIMLAEDMEIDGDGVDNEEEDGGEDGDEINEDEDEENGEVEVRLESEALPSTLPQGPDGLWVCPEPGCEHLVYAARDAEGQERVRRHLGSHTADLESLVRREARPNATVSYLLDLVRKRTETASVPQEIIDGKVVPQPIKKSGLR